MSHPSYPSLPPLDYTARDATDFESIRSDLKRNGVAVVTLYDASDPVIAGYEAGMVGLAAELRGDGGTPNGSRGMGGIVKPYAAGGHPAAARVRLDDRARDVHAGVYGVPTDDVMSSWDAVGILGTDAVRPKPPRVQSDDPRKRFHDLTGSSLEAHVDVGIGSAGAAMEAKMRRLHPEFTSCLQSQLVCRDVERGGATLVVSPGDWYDRPPAPTLFDMSKGKDFCKITDEGHAALVGTWRAVEVPRGSLVVWVSRLPHANKLADVGVDPRRLVVFVSWQSRRLVGGDEARAALKRKKAQAIASGASTDHWATHVPKMHRGSHYSNGAKRTKVLFTAASPPVYDEELSRKIDAAL